MKNVEWLNAIRLNPVCETTRLAYADWLDDNAACDRDRATAEFVRASCRGVVVNGTQMARAAYPWLEANWHRLLPTLHANHGYAFAAAQQPSAAETVKILNWRAGRRIGTTVFVRRSFPRALTGSHLNPFAREHLACRAVFEFWKGFLIFFALDIAAMPAYTLVRDAVKADQPLAVEAAYDPYGMARPPSR